MKKLFAMLLALTMTFQLITPAWADAAVEAPEEVTEASKVVEEVEEEIPETTEEETTEATEETLPEETTEATEEAIEPTLEELQEEEPVMEEVPEEEFALQSSQSIQDSGTCGANLKWELTEDGTITISGYGDMTDYGGKSTPWPSQSLKALYVTAGVTSIGERAFFGTSLESVHFGSASLALGNDCFSSCAHLTEIDFGTGTIKPGSNSFSLCDALTSVNIPSNVEMDEASYYGPGSGYQMFYNCAALKSATVDCAFVGPYVFESCYALQEVTFTNPDTEIYFVRSGSAHPFNSNGNRRTNVAVYGYECSEAHTLVQKTQGTAHSNMTFAQIPGDTTQHTEEIIPAVESTCETTGLTEGRQCSKCGLIFKAQEQIEKKEHLVIPVEAKEAGCTEPGNIAYWTCNGCGKVYTDAEGTQETTLAQVEIAPIGHNMTKTEAVAPTHTAPGNNEYYICSRCGKVYKDADGKTETTVEAETLEQLPGIASGTCGENLTWVVYEDGKLVISGYGEMDDYGEVNSSGGYSYYPHKPWSDYNVTSLLFSDGITKIGAFAFVEFKNLTGELYIPNTVISIGAGAFKGTSFQGKLKLPDNLTEIAAYAFEDCNGFTGTLEIPEGTTIIGNSAFYGCRNLIGELVFPEGLTSIGSRAFSGCIGFNGQLNFPSSLAEIGDSAFSDCSGFRGKLVIPETLTSIGSSAFSGCSGFSGFSLPENMTVIPDGMFSGWKGLKGVLTIPEYITGIGNRAFSSCSGLTGVHFSANLENIGDSAFYYCTGLTEELSFPYGLKTIGNSAFRECTSLTGNIIIPDSVTSIGANAFSTYGRYSLSGKLVLPKGIHFVDSNVFNGCYGLKTLYIPAEVIQIRADAFEKCNFTDIYYAGTSTQWQSVDIRSGNDILSTATLHFVESSGTTEDGIAWQYGSDGILTITGTGAIPDYTQESPAPWQGTQPVSLVIGDGITGIGTNAFANCETLRYVYFGGTKEAWSALPLGAGNEILSSAAVHCGPELRCIPNLVEEKQSTCAEQGNNAYYLCPDCGRAYKDAFCIQETSAEQETRALLPHNTEVVWAVQPSHTAPGNNKYFVCKNCGNAFKDQEGKIPTTVEAEILPQLPGIASGNCGDKGDNVTWVLYEDGLLEISGTGDMKNYSVYANWDNYKNRIKAVNIQDGVTSVGDYAFYYWYEELSSVHLPDSIQRIGKNAFYGCTGLKGELILPANLKRIEDDAFRDCTGITGTLNLPEKLEYLSGFNGCTGLSGTLTIPESVTGIGNSAFSGCTGFAGTLSFPEGLTSIGDSAFSGCTGFAGTLTFPKGLTSIGNVAFHGCTGFIGTLALPESLTTIGGNAFSGMTGLWGTLVLPATLESVGGGAFSACNGFSGELKLPNSTTEYGPWVFSGCAGITSISWPEGMTKIPDGMFSECSGLQGTLTLPDTITEIGSHAFYQCTNITGLHLPANLKKVGASAFDHSSIKGELILPDGLNEIGTEAFHCLDVSGRLVIPDSVRTIGQRAFGGNNGVENLVLPNGIQIIDEGTFRYCYRLKELHIPESVIQIRQSAFNGANIENVYYAGTLDQWKNVNIRTDNGNLSTATIHYIQSSGTCGDTLSWKIDSDNVLTVSGTGAMPDYTADSLAPWSDASFTGLVVEEGVTHIGAYAFYGHDTLAGTPSLPATLETVGESAFHGCAPDYFRYNGTPENWAKVTIGEDNEALQTVHYLEHTLSPVEAVPATCTQAGNNAYYLCDVCHQAFLDEHAEQPTMAEDQVLPALSHKTVHVDTKAATCTENGMEAHYTCGNCGKLFQDYYAVQEVTAEDLTIPALGHTMQETQAKEATCTENGNNLYYTCITCGIVFQDDQGESQTTVEAEMIPALGHTMVKTEAVAATCTEPGNNAYYTCTTCGNSYKDADGSQKTTTRAEFLPALGHTMKRIDTQAPTCTEDGNRAYYVCDTCHRDFKDASGSEATTAEAEVLPALGHRMTETQAKAATCTTSGNNAYFTCGTCHKVYKDADGQQETTKEAEILPALGHTMTETAAKEATCTASGNNAYFTCSTCHLIFKDGEGKQKTTVAAETLKALGHKMTKTAAKAATCTEDGNNVYFTCATCHKVYKDQQGTQETAVQAETLKAFGHSMTETPAKAATCTESGNNAYFTCGTCHKIYKDRLGTEETTVKEETLPALGHTMAKTEAKEPTCTASGNNAYYTCETCHQVFKDELGQRRTTVSAEKLSAFGHTMKKTAAKAATCTEPGNNLYYTCITCGIVFQDDQGEKQTTVDAETIPALGHTMQETPSVAPTCTEGGNNAYFTCETCHKVFKDAEGKQETTVKAETLAALGHHMILTAAVVPTCTESGTNAYYTCATCHKVYKDVDGKTETNVEAEILASIGHKMEAAAAKEPTCTETGSNAYYLCANCGKAYLDEQGEKESSVNAETIPALGHTMQETAAIAPTCTEGGNNVYYTCATCHKVFKDAEGEQETGVEAETLAPLGHSMVETPAVEPTHTSGGNNAYYTCSVCHKVFKDIDGQTETTAEDEQLSRLPGLAHGTSGSLSWFLSEEEVLTVSGAGRMPDYSGNDLAPWYAFRGKIQKVVLEEGVQTAGSYAFFDCNMLTEVELPQSVTKLGKSCFDGCGQLKLLSLEKVPTELTQKVTDLNDLATLAEPISSLVGNRAAYHWSLETIRGENQASNLANLDGTKLEVIHSGKFYLVCEEDYTGLSAAVEVGAKTSTEIRPDTEQLTGGESLALSAWAMPFDTELSAKWTLDQESEAYASISSDGTLTAKAVTAPVQITVKAQPANGEAAAEKTLWILPKTTGLGILADGHLAGETLTVDLTEIRELTLTAQIQPQGAGTKVIWTSSREDVAVIDETGKVILLKPGKTMIRAETQDGSGIAAELALTVRYLDGAEDLTLAAQIPETGLEPGMTAKLTLSGENAIDAQNVTFYIPENQAAIATIDETGTLTAGTTPGTVTVTAALKDDPLMRQAQLTVTVNPMLNHALRLESSISEGLGYVDGNTFYGEIAGIAGQNRSFALKVQGQDYLGNWAEAKNVTYASSNSAIAVVDASGTVSLTAKEEGTCQITVRCTDALEAEAQLTIVLQNSAPRLGATTVTLNSNSTQGATVDLVASYGNTVDTVTVYDYNKSTKTYALSTTFTAEAEEGTLTLYSLSSQKNGTYPVKLEVACRTGVYSFTMNVKVANTLPKVTVKQTAKLNLFYKNSTAPLAVTAPGQTVTDMTLTDTADFTLMPGEEGWEIVYSSENAKPDTKGTLNVYLEGYQEPMKVNLTVGTVTTAPAVKLSAASSTLNTALNSELATRVTLLDKAGQPLELENPTVESSNADVSVNGSLLTIALDEAKSTTVTMYLQDSTWARSVKLIHKITVSNKLPTLKPAGNLTLNSLFAARTAETGMVLSQSNLTLVNVKAVPAAKVGTLAYAESEKLNVAYDPETRCIAAKIADASIKAGTYGFNCTGTLETGETISGGTLKVTVSAAAPKVKLSASSVKLNQYLAGEEQGTVKVTAPNGYQVVDVTGKSDGMFFDEDAGILTVKLQSNSDKGGTYNLYPVVRDLDTMEEAALPTKLTFKVQAYNSSKLSVSVSAKGKLDTQTDSEITYTVTKLTNCLGTVDNMVLEGQDAGLFQADIDFVNGKPTVHLTLVDGITYETNKAYKVQFRFYACGTEILSPVQTVKVTQTALKVTAPKTITYYQAQKSPLRVVLTTNVPLDELELNSKTTAKEFQLALGEMTWEGNRVMFEIKDPSALKAGKSYSVALDAKPVNNAENVKPVTIKLTVKVMK